MREADPLALPLEGVSLVEASAGTGKTTALVRTYLRALLTTQHTVDRLLVVTFTRAATGELTTRIRKALAGMHAVLNGAAEPDAFQARLLRHAGDAALLRKRVDAAFTALDESAVFTIHGFCQRMLADFAFEVGGAFTLEQRNEEESLREEIAADFWRRRQADAGPAYARWLLATFVSPEDLLSELRRPLRVSGELRVAPEADAEAVAAAEASFDAAARAASQAWRADADALRDWLLESDDLNRTKYHKGTTARLLDEWDAWLAEPPYPVLPDRFERLTRAKAEASLKKGAVPEVLFFDKGLGDALQDAAADLAAAWWQETYASALGYLREEARARKRRAREIGFDDMLQDLRDALAGDGGDVLAARIAKRFPLALVDEFQDTDPRQYEIFDRIYSRRRQAGLILIGDPKQAIYRFRGADVFAYMRARAASGKRERLYGLTRNFRSAAPLIAAVNALFGRAEAPFVYERIPFVDVAPGRPIAPLEVAGGDDAPLTVVWHAAPKDAKDGVAAKGDAERALAAACADEIRRLLALGEEGKARYRDKDDKERPVRARDVAVLVSTHRQGEAVQQALRAHRIASVTLANDSVFETEEAKHLETLLAAVAAPASGSLLRRALATPLLGATAEELAALADDEARWSGLAAAFREYNRSWQLEGYSAMFARLLREQSVIGRTLARADGERAMTNLRHLAELAEAHAARRPGIESLMAWLARERAEIHRGDESRELRLESDDELVRIVTVHKAKGLEYPVVFLPFLWSARDPEKKDGDHPAVLAHDADYQPVLDLGSPALDERMAAAAEEDRAEQARLAYVALTRAAHACYVLATPANQSGHSALARLLGAEDPLALEGRLAAWCKAAPAGAMHFRAPLHARRGPRAAEDRRHGEARAFEHPERLRQRFHVASYSLLATGARGPMAERPDWDETVKPAPVLETAEGIHAFPAGAASGTFLHALLEQADFAAPATALEAAVRDKCREFGFAEHWAATLAPWLAGMRATPLGPAGCTLADLAPERSRAELEFHFPLAGLAAGTLDAMVSRFAPRGPRPALHFAEVAGQMKGYVDLVFEHEGRYWLADYKSNRLGSDLAAYTPAALDRAMTEHRYDLQYLIYTVALHRYLAARIEGYDYERHFGGVLYLFLRGMAPDAPAPRGVWHTRPVLADVQRLDALLAGADRA